MAIDDLYGWFPRNQPIPGGSDRWMTTPERSGTSGLLSFTNSEPGKFSKLAYEMAGSPKFGPNKGVNMPWSAYPEDDEAAGGGGGADALGGLLSDPGALGKAKDYVGGLLGGGSSAGVSSVASGMAPADAAAYTSMFSGGSPAAVFGGGAAIGGSGAALGSAAAYDAMLAGASPSVVFGGSGGAIGSTAAYDAMLAGGSPSAVLGGEVAAGGTGAAGSAGGGALAGSGITTALPIAAAGWIAADLANKSLIGHGDERRNESGWMQAYPGTKGTDYGIAARDLPAGTLDEIKARTGRPAGVTRGGMAQVVQLPNGKYLSKREFEGLSGAWYGATYAPDGNQAYWQSEYDRLAQMYGL